MCNHKRAVCFATRMALRDRGDQGMWPDRYHLCGDCGSIGWTGTLDKTYHERWISPDDYDTNLGTRDLGKKAKLLMEAQRNRLKSP